MIHRYRKLTNFLFHGNTKQLPLRKYVRPIYYFLESVIIYPILQRYGFEKISSTRPQENRQIDRSRSRFPKKTATNSEAIETRRENSSRWNSTFEYPTRRFPIYSIRYKWQDRRGGGGREERRWMAPSNRNSYRWCYETYKYFARWWWHRYDCSFNLDRESPPLRVL